MLIAAALSVLAAAPAAAPAPAPSPAALVAQIRHADYTADRAALARLADELAPFADDREMGAKVRYWRGFAYWRRALNGFNDSAPAAELEQDLTKGVAELEKALALSPGFVDAKVGLVACLQNLSFLHYVQKDQPKATELMQRSLPLLREAEVAEPDNPRLLWVLGAWRWYNPKAPGGGQAAAIATYEKGLQAARAKKAANGDALTPTWGEAELLMNLAFASLNREKPDPAAAERYARQALALVPDWHYVRDVLLPQIGKAREAGKSQ
ncbi:MAG TPA: hypothetical protein VGE98_08130 [Thermoanaerobaculia bacterium]